MTAKIAITRSDEDSRARYVARVDGLEGEGELTLSKASPVLVIADHTLVDDRLRGQGVAGALVERLIADARAAGQRIVPLCPYVRAQAERHREAWADVIQW